MKSHFPRNSPYSPSEPTPDYPDNYNGASWHHRQQQFQQTHYVRDPNVNVVTMQPSPQTSAVSGSRPPNLMIPAILACICCCWPIGIFAIWAASNANSAANQGDFETAKRKAKMARILIIVAVICGIVIAASYTAYRVVLLNKTYQTYNSYESTFKRTTISSLI